MFSCLCTGAWYSKHDLTGELIPITDESVLNFQHQNMEGLGASGDTQSYCLCGQEFRKSGVVLPPSRMEAGMKMDLLLAASLPKPSPLCPSGSPGPRQGKYIHSFWHRSPEFITHLFSIAPWQSLVILIVLWLQIRRTNRFVLFHLFKGRGE